MVDPDVTVPACDFVGRNTYVGGPINRDALAMHVFGVPEARGLEALQVVAREEDMQFTTTRPVIALEVIHAGIRIVALWRGLRHTNVLGWSIITDLGVQVLRSEIERTRRGLVDHYARIALANVPPLITGDFEQLVRKPDVPVAERE